MRIDVVIPSRDRHNGLLRAIASVALTTGGRDVRIIAVLDKEDPESHDLVRHLHGVKVVTMPDNYVHGHPQHKYQVGYEASDADWIVGAADDVTFRCGWLDAALSHPSQGFVGLNDATRQDDLATLIMVTKEFTERVMGGNFGLPWYHSWWCDNEWRARVGEAGAYTVCRESVFDHHHCAYTGVNDSIEEIAHSHRGNDQATFFARRKAGFPEEWERVW